MIVKPTKFKSKHLIPQPKHKNYNRDPDLDNKENILIRKTKCDSYQRYFGKDITSSYSNNQNVSQLNNQNLLKKNSYSNRSGSETQKTHFYIKKTPTISQGNRRRNYNSNQIKNNDLYGINKFEKREISGERKINFNSNTSNNSGHILKGKTTRSANGNYSNNLGYSVAMNGKMGYYNSFNLKETNGKKNSFENSLSISNKDMQYMRHSHHIKNSIRNFSNERNDDNKYELKKNKTNKTNNSHINIDDNSKISEGKNKTIEKLNDKIDITKISESMSTKNQSLSINFNVFEEQKPSQINEKNISQIKNDKETINNENINTKENNKENENNKEEKKEEKKEKEPNFKPIKIEDKYYGLYFEKNQNENIQIPTEYIDTIYHNLLEEENEGIESKAEYNYMKKQNEINEQMRSILIDWIIDVHCKFGFTDETLFMTISIIDRFLTSKKITRSKLQLLGVTALMISCKHEEIDLPKADDFIYITDNAYSRDEIFKMENDVLDTLNFSLLYPSPIKFFELLSYQFKFNKKQFMMGKYLMESFLIDIKNTKYKPSIISCACSYIVMKFFKMNNYHDSYSKKWYLLNENYSIPSGLSVKECAKDICLFVDNIHKSNYTSTEKKYSKPEYEKVAQLIVGK